MPSFCQGLHYVFSFFGSHHSSNNENYVINGDSRGYRHCSKFVLTRDEHLSIYAQNFIVLVVNGGMEDMVNSCIFCGNTDQV